MRLLPALQMSLRDAFSTLETHPQQSVRAAATLLLDQLEAFQATITKNADEITRLIRTLEQVQDLLISETQRADEAERVMREIHPSSWSKGTVS